jgi:hypothetical protein
MPTNSSIYVTAGHKRLSLHAGHTKNGKHMTYSNTGFDNKRLTFRAFKIKLSVNILTISTHHGMKTVNKHSATINRLKPLKRYIQSILLNITYEQD